MGEEEKRMNVTRVEQELHTAICHYTNARQEGKSGAEESHGIKDAITALDRAAYEQGCSSADEDKWRLQTALDRERNIVGPLRRDLAETRTLRCQDTRQLVLRDEEIEQLRAKLADALEDGRSVYESLGNIAAQRDRYRKERDAARRERDLARAARDHVVNELAVTRETLRRLQCAANDAERVLAGAMGSSPCPVTRIGKTICGVCTTYLNEGRYVCGHTDVDQR